MKKADTSYMSSVKVGPKGQVVIPKEIRQMFQIQPGDTLLMLADTQRGIAIERQSVFSKIIDAVFAGKTQTDQGEEEKRLEGLLRRFRRQEEQGQED